MTKVLPIHKNCPTDINEIVNILNINKDKEVICNGVSYKLKGGFIKNNEVYGEIEGEDFDCIDDNDKPSLCLNMQKKINQLTFHQGI